MTTDDGLNGVETELEMTGTKIKLKPAPLPPTREAMLAARLIKREVTLNDQVDVYHRELYTDERSPYAQYLNAVYNADAQEGAVVFDMGKAAELIREFAREHENDLVASQKIAPLVAALKVVLRRYGMSHTQRLEVARKAQTTAETHT